MIRESAPHVEVINNVRVRELGSKYKEKINRIKEQFTDQGDANKLL